MLLEATKGLQKPYCNFQRDLGAKGTKYKFNADGISAN